MPDAGYDPFAALDKLHFGVAPQSESKNGQHTQKPWDECLLEGMCSSTQLQRLNIAAPKPIVGDWLREGDLGFIYAIRGLGKTWIALDVAHGMPTEKKAWDLGKFING